MLKNHRIFSFIFALVPLALMWVTNNYIIELYDVHNVLEAFALSCPVYIAYLWGVFGMWFVRRMDDKKDKA